MDTDPRTGMDEEGQCPSDATTDRALLEEYRAVLIILQTVPYRLVWVGEEHQAEVKQVQAIEYKATKRHPRGTAQPA